VSGETQLRAIPVTKTRLHKPSIWSTISSTTLSLDVHDDGLLEVVFLGKMSRSFHFMRVTNAFARTALVVRMGHEHSCRSPCLLYYFKIHVLYFQVRNELSRRWESRILVSHVHCSGPHLVDKNRWNDRVMPCLVLPSCVSLRSKFIPT